MKKEDKYVYKYAALNAQDQTELVLVAVSTQEKKNMPNTQVFVMREVDFEQ